MAEPMILELLSNLKTRVATNETNIATNKSTIATNKTLFDNHTKDDTRHWTTTDRQNFDRVVHFKGYFTTEAKLKEAYPTGSLGDYAIVGESDTVWAWDDTSKSWLNTTEQGVVISVNGRTGEVVLGKTDVGLSNVDNTSDVNKPVSTAQQAALDAKVSKRNISLSEANSLLLEAGIYDLDTTVTIKDFTAGNWNIIVGDSINNDSIYSSSQIWTNYSSNSEQHIYIRHQQNAGQSWTEFRELMTNIHFDELQTQITENKNSINTLNNNKMDRLLTPLQNADSTTLRAGVYGVQSSNTIFDCTSDMWTVFVTEGYTGSKYYSASQIWMCIQDEDMPRMFYRKVNIDGSNYVWSDFVEILTTNDFSKAEITRVKQYKGYFADLEALVAAAPTGQGGDFAIIGSAAAIYIWNTIENTWTAISGGGGGGSGSGVVTSVNGLEGDVVLTKNNIGLTNVDNTSDADKPISTAQQAEFNKKVNKAGDTMTGALQINNVTDATNKTTGALSTSGGISAQKAIYAGTTVTAETHLIANGEVLTKNGIINYNDKASTQYNESEECIEFIFY